MRKIRIGLIGCGFVAETHHLPAYLQLQEAQLVAVADINRSRAESMAKKFRLNSWYEDYHQVLKRGDVDAVDVCVPPRLHAKIAVDAAEARKHVLCEKPMALSLDEADSMIKAAEANNVNLMIGHTLRFVPSYVKAKKMVENGRIGETLFARSRHIGMLGEGAISRYYLKPGAGGDVLFNRGVHMVDLLVWFLGDAKNVYSLHNSYGIIGKDVCDRAVIAIEHRDGTLSETCLAYTSLSNIPRGLELEIFGTEGWLSVEGYEGKITVFREGALVSRVRGPTVVKLKTTINPFLSELEEFTRSIIEGRKPKISGEDGRKAVEVILAAKRSQAEGRTIALSIKPSRKGS